MKTIKSKRAESKSRLGKEKKQGWHPYLYFMFNSLRVELIFNLQCMNFEERKKSHCKYVDANVVRDLWEARSKDGIQQSPSHPQASGGRQRGVIERSLALLRSGTEFDTFFRDLVNLRIDLPHIIHL